MATRTLGAQNAVLELRHVTKRFGGDTAVDDVSVAIKEHEFVTLLGPSGCGKTTTLRMLAGFTEPDGGEILSHGKVLSRPGMTVPPEERGMGMVFQNYAVWPHKSVVGNIAYGLRLKKLSRIDVQRRVEEILQLVDLSGLGERSPSQLSGGQLQRVALARSLVVEPEVMLLDEPLSNLDAKLRERMRSEIKEIQRRTGITFIYVTHDQAEALALSDRIVVMDQGTVQQIGTPKEVYSRPATRMVADFMGQVNIVRGVVTEIDDGADKTRRSGTIEVPHGIRVTATLPSNTTLDSMVEVAIRPEDIVLREVAHSTEGVGRVVEAVYLGNIVDYQVEIEDNLILRAQAHPNSGLRLGALVEIRADDGWVLAARDIAQTSDDGASLDIVDPETASGETHE